MINSFWALSQKLKTQGLETPLLKIKKASSYTNLENAVDSIKKIGKEIEIIGLNFPDGPLIIGILGTGSISSSVQEIINCIPCSEMKPEELEEFFESGFYSENRIYYVYFQEKHLVKPIELADDFELKDYYENPDKYESQFEKYIPYLTVIINTFTWSANFPKFMTINGLKRLYEAGLMILRIIGDLSGDINGFNELTIKTTSAKEPVFTFDLASEEPIEGFSGKGPSIVAMDNFSGELAKDSSKHLSNILRDLIPKITNASYKGNFDQSDLPKDIKSGVIVYRGELTPNFNFLSSTIM